MGSDFFLDLMGTANNSTAGWGRAGRGHLGTININKGKEMGYPDLLYPQLTLIIHRNSLWKRASQVGGDAGDVRRTCCRHKLLTAMGAKGNKIRRICLFLSGEKNRRA